MSDSAGGQENKLNITIKSNLNIIEENIENVCRRCGRKRHEIRLMGISKFHPVQTVETAFEAGLRLFGESRLQEGKEKFLSFWEKHPRDGSLELHLVGSLQRNKAKAAAAFFDCIQSVDREPLIEELGALTKERENPLMVMLEYHTAEETKSGFIGHDELFSAAEKLLAFPGLRPAGLMTMAPFTNDESAIRTSFRKLAEARAELEKRFASANWSSLSMGMTSDFEIAIEEGSTLIRIGSAIFGEL